MTAFCTYCSKKKRKTPGSLPAIKRYVSDRIQAVFVAAVAVKIDFRILSGKYGLIGACDPIPCYDHLLEAPEIAHMTEVVRSQIHEAGISHLVYFTRAVTTDPQLEPYFAVIEAAAVASGARLSVIELPETL